MYATTASITRIFAQECASSHSVTCCLVLSQAEVAKAKVRKQAVPKSKSLYDVPPAVMRCARCLYLLLCFVLCCAVLCRSNAQDASVVDALTTCKTSK